MGSEHSGRVLNSPALGKPVLVTQTSETNLEFQNVKITNSEYVQKVFQNAKNRSGHNEDHSQMAMEAEKTNISTWTVSMVSSMKAALHMDPSYTENLEVVKNSECENIESMFNITRKMIGENSDIMNVSSLETVGSSLERITLLNDQAMKWAKARRYVHSDSVLCLGGLSSPNDANRKWEEQVSTLTMCSTFRELQGLDGEPIYFEWKIFPGSSALQLLHTIQKDLEGKCIIPENFSDQLIFLSMFNDIHLDKRGNEDSCALTSRTIRDCASSFKNGHRAFLGPGEEKTSGNMIMQPVTKANGTFVLQERWTISRILDILYSKQFAHWVVEYWRGRTTETPSMFMKFFPTLTCCTELFVRRISSVSTEQSQIGVRSSLKQILERKSFWIWKCSENTQRHPNEARRAQVFGWYSIATTCFGKPNAPESGKFPIDAKEEE